MNKRLFLTNQIARLLQASVFIGIVAISIHPSAHAKLTIKEFQVIDALRGEGSAKWEPFMVKTQENQALIRKTLEQVIRNPGKFKKDTSVDDAEESHALLVRRAIIEYGKFATQPNGELYSDSNDLYKELLKNPSLGTGEGESNIRFVLHSLKNANTPSTAQMMSQQLEHPDTEVRFLALRLLEKSFNPGVAGTSTETQEGTKAGVYNPHLERILSDRGAVDAWRSVAMIIQQRLNTITEQETALSEDAKVQINRTRFVISKLMSGEKIQIAELQSQELKEMKIVPDNLIHIASANDDQPERSPAVRGRQANGEKGTHSQRRLATDEETREPALWYDHIDESRSTYALDSWSHYLAYILGLVLATIFTVGLLAFYLKRKEYNPFQD